MDAVARLRTHTRRNRSAFVPWWLCVQDMDHGNPISDVITLPQRLRATKQMIAVVGPEADAFKSYLATMYPGLSAADAALARCVPATPLPGLADITMTFDTNRDLDSYIKHKLYGISNSRKVCTVCCVFFADQSPRGSVWALMANAFFAGLCVAGAVGGSCVHVRRTQLGLRHPNELHGRAVDDAGGEHAAARH
jgi:hypothetical protein